jgi:hypothetical protein
MGILTEVRTHQEIAPILLSQGGRQGEPFERSPTDLDGGRANSFETIGIHCAKRKVFPALFDQPLLGERSIFGRKD